MCNFRSDIIVNPETNTEMNRRLVGLALPMLTNSFRFLHGWQCSSADECGLWHHGRGLITMNFGSKKSSARNFCNIPDYIDGMVMYSMSPPPSHQNNWTVPKMSTGTNIIWSIAKKLRGIYVLPSEHGIEIQKLKAVLSITSYDMTAGQVQCSILIC